MTGKAMGPLDLRASELVDRAMALQNYKRATFSTAVDGQKAIDHINGLRVGPEV